jgi:non-ribosomal peptide synthetase component F
MSLFMTLLAGFEIFLHLHTGQEDVALTTNIANRNRIETEGLLGLFMNVLVLRVNLAGDPDGRTLLRRVREVTLGAYDHQDLPFVRVLEELRPGRETVHNELFPVGFVLQNAPLPAVNLPGLEVRPIEVENGTAKRDFILIVGESERELTTVATFRNDLFDRETVGRMLAQYEGILDDLATNPDRPLSGFRLN